MNKTRTGKIARLPKDLRDKVNILMRDGAEYSQIIEMLQEHQVGVSEQNLTNWRQGGHQEWLKEQERLADMRLKREFALEIAQQNEGSKLHEATLHLAQSQLYEVLTEFDLGPLKDLLRDKPANYAKVVTALAKLSKGALDIEKFKEQLRSSVDKAIDALMIEAQAVPAAIEYLGKARLEFRKAVAAG
jgi:hypothetical protein